MCHAQSEHLIIVQTRTYLRGKRNPNRQGGQDRSKLYCPNKAEFMSMNTVLLLIMMMIIMLS